MCDNFSSENSFCQYVPVLCVERDLEQVYIKNRTKKIKYNKFQNVFVFYIV